jgi:hypothetical protein
VQTANLVQQAVMTAGRRPAYQLCALFFASMRFGSLPRSHRCSPKPVNKRSVTSKWQCAHCIDQTQLQLLPAVMAPPTQLSVWVSSSVRPSGKDIAVVRLVTRGFYGK